MYHFLKIPLRGTALMLAVVHSPLFLERVLGGFLSATDAVVPNF
jgi:hypothetical protein